MSEPVLWSMEPHTAAKHRVLRSFLGGWIGVMGHEAERSRRLGVGRPSVLLVDGFAGPGRYSGGEPGSPIILLDALLSHTSFPEFSGVEFVFIFIEHDSRRIGSLRREIDGLGRLPPNVDVRIEPGEFEAVVAEAVAPIVAGSGHSIPTFAFIDPFGYSSASMSTTGRLLDFPRCEALYFLPMSFIHRFVGRADQDRAFNTLFGCEEWRQAIPLSGEERTAFLLDLFERQLERNRAVEHIRSFQLRTQDGKDYRLVFGLGHLKGLELAKDAMWGVDPLTGTSYTGVTDSGQEVLFTPGDHVDTLPLLGELRARFGTAWFTIEQADRVTLLHTPFKKTHLRERTLRPAEEEDKLKVERTGPRGFKGARMRFLR